VRLSLTIACASGALMAVTQAASAAPLEREHYSGSFDDTFTDTDCGDPITIDYHVEFSGLFMLKEGRRGDPTPYFFDNYSSVETFTNVANDKTASITHNAMWKDLRIELVEGTVYRFTAIEPGRPVVVIGPDGRRLVFDAGRIFWTFVVDTQGDQDLSNDVFLQDPQPSAAGPHPILEGADFCDFLDLLR
jgi:hypothetical protein